MILSLFTTIRKTIAAGILLSGLIAIPVSAAETAENDSTAKREWKYIPQFHGTLRTFYEWSTATGQSKFSVRNARLTVGGYILPKVDYFMQVDLCAAGKILILDAYARVTPVDGLFIYAGQMRVPFSVESSRRPCDYHFADVSLVADLGNLRSVGVKAGYTVPKTTLYFEGGIFNGTDKAEHNTWNSQLTYSIKANYTKAGFRPELAFMSRVDGGQDTGRRFNQFNASLSWSNSNWFIEGEYIGRYMKHAEGERVPNAYDIFVDYGFPVKWKLANRLSVQARADGVTNGRNFTDCNRLTFGATAHYSYKSLFMDFRINFEQYFYNSGAVDIETGRNNKLVAGVIVAF